jgi:hypothetical protein
MIFATIVRGWGGPAPDGYWLILIKTLAAQFFMLVSLTCVGVFLVFVTKRALVACGLYLLFLYIPAELIPVAMELHERNSGWWEYTMVWGIYGMGFLEQLDTRTMLIIFGMGAFYIVATTLAGIALFRRTEIK